MGFTPIMLRIILLIHHTHSFLPTLPECGLVLEQLTAPYYWTARENKIADGTPCVSDSPFNRADFCGQGTGHFKNNANRLFFQKANFPIQPQLKTPIKTNKPPIMGFLF